MCAWALSFSTRSSFRTVWLTPLPPFYIHGTTRHGTARQEAIEYGLIDQVLESTRDLPLGLIPQKQPQEENDLSLADVRSYSNPRGYGDSADPDMPF